MATENDVRGCFFFIGLAALFVGLWAAAGWATAFIVVGALFLAIVLLNP